MFDRPHKLVSVGDLRSLAQARWQDRSALESVAAELSSRTGTAAALLLGAIQARLREMPQGSGGAVDRLSQELEEERHHRRQAQEEATQLRSRLADERAARPSDDALARLNRQLDEERWRRLQATEEAARLRQQLEALRPGAARGLAAYAELHLLPDIPDDLLEALHKAFQKHYHPDRPGLADKAGANDRFQAMERAFAAIREARGLG
ncbi:MAG TPA: hypothetical protein VM899_01895 [Rubellimicrobium sp.]|nr:hypothetical protein [Rubellimicrobium sp.]